MFKFNDEVHDYQRFVRENIKKLGDLTIISEQLLIKDMEKGFIDVLALDMATRRIVVLELKNISAGDDIVGQSIKYYDFLKRGSTNLYELLAKVKLDFSVDEINLDPKIMLIVPEFSQQLLRSLSYVHGIEIEVVKFNAIQKNGYYEIIREVFVPDKEYRQTASVEIEGEVTKIWNFEEYIKSGIDKNKISLAKQLVFYLDSLCREKGSKLDVYFYKDKITLMTGKKVVAHAKISKKWFDNTLDIIVSMDKDKSINITKLQYSSDIQKYNLGARNLKMKCLNIPTDILKEIL